MFSKKTFVVVGMMVGALLAACGSSGGNGGAGGSGNTGSDGTGAGSSSSAYTCCINDAHYRCPDKAAFDKCAGFDVNACLQTCDPSNFGCQDACFAKLDSEANDPSDCVEDAAVQCTGGGGGGGTPGACVGDWDGAKCDYDADCASNNCYQNKCYGNDVGNPCDYDADCTSNNCYQNCCYDNGKGSPCDYDADCTSNNCYDNACQ